MEIVLIRHGEPEWVRDGLNVVDPPLTDRGLHQAVRVAAALDGEQFDEIVISPLLRPRMTAGPLLAKLGAEEVIEAFFEEIRLALEQGESVKLSGFGNFQLRNKPQRPGRNPKTGEEIPITARRVVTFHASQKLKAMVEQAHEGNGTQRQAPEQ